MSYFLTITMGGDEALFIRYLIKTYADHEPRWQDLHTFLEKGTIKKMGYDLIQGEVIEIELK